MPIQISGHEHSGLVVAWIFAKRSSEHTYPGGGFSINNVSFASPVHDSDKVPSTFQKSLTLFSCNTSRFVWVVLVTSKCFSEIGNDSSFGTWRWTRGSVWWRWMKSPSIDQKSFRASAPSCGPVGWDPSAFIRKSPQEIFTPYKMILPWSCLLDFMISSKQFCRAVCDWENVFSPILDVIISFALSLRAWTSERPIFHSSSRSAFRKSPFQILTAYSAYPSNIPGNIFLLNWRSLDWSFADRGWYSTMESNGNTGPLNEWFSTSSFPRAFPVCQEDLDISQIAVTLHGLSHPLFDPSQNFQQDCRCSFLNSAHCSLSNATRLGSMRCWRSVFPW